MWIPSREVSSAIPPGVLAVRVSIEILLGVISFWHILQKILSRRSSFNDFSRFHQGFFKRSGFIYSSKKSHFYGSEMNQPNNKDIDSFIFMVYSKKSFSREDFIRRNSFLGIFFRSSFMDFTKRSCFRAICLRLNPTNKMLKRIRTWMTTAMRATVNHYENIVRSQKSHKNQAGEPPVTKKQIH